MTPDGAFVFCLFLLLVDLVFLGSEGVMQWIVYPEDVKDSAYRRRMRRYEDAMQERVRIR